jgi:hypothetical protein
LPLPALAIAVLDMFSGERPFDIKTNEKFRAIYRVLGLGVLGILILIVTGRDPYLEIKNYVINFPEHWANFLDQCLAIWSWISEHAQSYWQKIYEFSSNVLAN